MNLKWTKENVTPMCEGCISVSQVLRKLGIKSGSNERLHKIIKGILKENGTYVGVMFNVGRVMSKKSNEDFFTNGDAKRSTHSVRQALFKRGIKEKRCECCGNKEWQGNPIPLEVHHKDGDKYNNELVNLEILCPNCHYFTDTYKIKNISKPYKT